MSVGAIIDSIVRYFKTQGAEFGVCKLLLCQCQCLKISMTKLSSNTQVQTFAPEFNFLWERALNVPCGHDLAVVIVLSAGRLLSIHSGRDLIEVVIHQSYLSLSSDLFYCPRSLSLTLPLSIHIMKKCIFVLFVNQVKTTERINMGLRPYDAKSSVGRHRLFFYIPYTHLYFILD